MSKVKNRESDTSGLDDLEVYLTTPGDPIDYSRIIIPTKKRKAPSAFDRAAKRAQRHADALRKSQQREIVYDRAPRDDDERQERLDEQRARAEANGRDWTKLSPWQVEKKIRFGSKAVCRRPRDARDLAKIQGHIAQEWERSACRDWHLDNRQERELNSVIGFGSCSRALSSNKAVRVDLAHAFSRELRQFYKENRKKLHFCYITVIHDGWHTFDNDTVVDISDIRQRVANLMKRYDLDFVGCIEFDAINNYPRSGGKWVMPHVHLVAWSEQEIEPKKLAAAMRKSRRLKSAMRVPTVDISRIMSAEAMVHKAYYATKPFRGCKSLGSDTKTGKPKLYSVSSSVRPVMAIRIAEIHSLFDVSQLLLSRGAGKKLKHRTLAKVKKALTLSASSASNDNHSAFWDRIMPKAKRRLRPPVLVT